MSEPKRRAPRLGWVVVALASLPALYVLSIGPAYSVALAIGGGRQANELLGSAYAPIVWACRQSQFVDDVITWYIRTFYETFN